MLAKTLLAALAVLCCAAPAASASVVGSPSTATDGLLYEAVAVADEWWAALDQYPDAARLYDYDELEIPDSVVARGDVGGPGVYFPRPVTRRLRRNLRRPWGWSWRRLVYERLCMTAIHERGHNLGLRHEAGGVMGKYHPTVGRCKAWAVAKAPALGSKY